MSSKDAIDELTKRFYSLFTNRAGIAPNVAGIYDLFVENGVIIKTCGETPVVYDLDAFVEPRQRLLHSGELAEFEEEEVEERTSVVGYVAQRMSLYRKAGVLRGEPFAQFGVKVMQFVRVSGMWKISAVAWDDEREGFTLDPQVLEKMEPRPPARP